MDLLSKLKEASDNLNQNQGENAPTSVVVETITPEAKPATENPPVPPAPEADNNDKNGNTQPPAPSEPNPPVADPPKKILEQDVLDFLKEKGRDINTLDELFIVPEPVIQEKIVNPYEGLIDDEDKQYLEYKKETGRSRKDFEYLNTDFEKMNSLDLARERIRVESGQKLTDDQADSYLAKKLNVDLSDPAQIDSIDEIEISAYAKQYRDQKIAEKEKFRQPIAPKQEAPKEDMVELADGSIMKKTDYNNLIGKHQKHVEEAQAAVNSVTEVAFKLSVDDNGTPRDLNYAYEFSTEDRHSMLSTVSDVNGTMEKRYRSENGFNHKQFAEDMFWSDPKNREKAISSMLNAARAEAIEETLKVGNNVNYSTQKLPTEEGNPNVKIVPVKELFN